MQILRVRRATLDDLVALKEIWNSMRFPADELEPHLTEFQVVENADGEILGGIGLQMSKQHALLYCEGYSDFSIADNARQLFWERIQTLASNLGVFRIWTQERSPFWRSYGFQKPYDEILSRLPQEWKNELVEDWLTFQLKNEEIINAAFERELVKHSKSENSNVDGVVQQAKVLRTILTFVCFAIFAVCVVVIVWLMKNRNPFAH